MFTCMGAGTSSQDYICVCHIELISVQQSEYTVMKNRNCRQSLSYGLKWIKHCPQNVHKRVLCLWGVAQRVRTVKDS